MADPLAKQDNLKEKLRMKMGIANAMGSHAKATASAITEAADRHGQAAHYLMQQLGGRVTTAGLGNDPEAEDGYCKALVERHRLHQCYTLAAGNAEKFPDITPDEQHMQKSLSRLMPEDRAGYAWGTVREAGPDSPDDYQPRLYDPQELLAREPERDKDLEKVAFFRELYRGQDPNKIDPLVLVRTEHGREILDGHHRALGAKEADRKCRAVEVSDETFQRLKSEGFSPMDIAYATLALGGSWDAADKVKGQFDGNSVRRTGYLCYERLMRGMD